MLFYREQKLDWADRLVLPTRFSTPTTKAIESGVLTKNSRVEIVDSLATFMLIHTSRPTPQDFTTISRRLIEKYPKLRDAVDNGYVSHCCYYILYTILMKVSTHFFRVLGEVNCGSSSKTCADPAVH